MSERSRALNGRAQSMVRARIVACLFLCWVCYLSPSRGLIKQKLPVNSEQIHASDLPGLMSLSAQGPSRGPSNLNYTGSAHQSLAVTHKVGKRSNSCFTCYFLNRPMFSGLPSLRHSLDVSVTVPATMLQLAQVSPSLHDHN